MRKFDLGSFMIGVLFTLIGTLIFWGEWIEKMDCFK